MEEANDDSSFPFSPMAGQYNNDLAEKFLLLLEMKALDEEKVLELIRDTFPFFLISANPDMIERFWRWLREADKQSYLRTAVHVTPEDVLLTSSSFHPEAARSLAAKMRALHMITWSANVIDFLEKPASSDNTVFHTVLSKEALEQFLAFATPGHLVRLSIWSQQAELYQLRKLVEWLPTKKYLQRATHPQAAISAAMSLLSSVQKQLFDRFVFFSDPLRLVGKDEAETQRVLQEQISTQVFLNTVRRQIADLCSIDDSAASETSSASPTKPRSLDNVAATLIDRASLSTMSTSDIAVMPSSIDHVGPPPRFAVGGKKRKSPTEQLNTGKIVTPSSVEPDSKMPAKGKPTSHMADSVGVINFKRSRTLEEHHHPYSAFATVNDLSDAKPSSAAAAAVADVKGTATTHDSSDAKPSSAAAVADVKGTATTHDHSSITMDNRRNSPEATNSSFTRWKTKRTAMADVNDSAKDHDDDGQDRGGSAPKRKKGVLPQTTTWI